MTGLERLQELVDDMAEWSVFTVMKRDWCERHGVTVIDGRMAMKDLLSEIADQIERETAHDPSKDVSMSAYDLLPECDRKAISLALDCGGVEEIKKRLMPEGMEWPMFEDGDPVRIGDEFMGKDGKTYTVQQVQFIGKCFSLYDFCDRKAQFNAFYGERVKRPATKVLDADGVEIRVGDTVYLLPGDWCDRFPLLRCHEWDAMKVLDLSPTRNTGRIGCGMSSSFVVCYPYPSQLTHRAPVIAADGRPLREGEHVYHVETGAELVVKELPNPGEYQAVVVFAPPASHLTSFDPDQLTHERPDSWEKYEEKLCYLLDDGDLASEMTERAKALAERGER